MLTSHAIDALVLDRRARSCSPRTEQFYRTQLTKLQRVHVELPTTPEPIKELLGDIIGVPETKRAFYRAIHALYEFLELDGQINANDNPLRRIRAPRVPKKLQRTLDPGDVAALLAATSSARDRLLLLSFLDGGIRVGELRSLRGRDVRAQGIRVVGKTGERNVPIHKEILDELRTLARAPDDPLFHNRVGGQLATRTIYKLVRCCLARVGLDVGKSGPHVLRHTFGRSFIASGGDIRSLQKILGHADIATTAGYVNLSDDEVKREHEEHAVLVKSVTLRRVV